MFNLEIMMVVSVFKSHTPLQQLWNPCSRNPGAAFAFPPANSDNTTNLPPLSASLAAFVSSQTDAGGGI